MLRLDLHPLREEVSFGCIMASLHKTERVTYHHLEAKNQTLVTIKRQILQVGVLGGLIALPYTTLSVVKLPHAAFPREGLMWHNWLNCTDVRSSQGDVINHQRHPDAFLKLSTRRLHVVQKSVLQETM